MSTAVSPAKAVKDAQANIAAMIPRQENKMGTRYAWYGLDSIHHHDLDAMTNGANGGRMHGPHIVPYTQMPISRGHDFQAPVLSIQY